MGKASRDKGNRGQSEAEALLLERGFTITKTSAGRSDPDFVAVHPTNGHTYAIEVKNCVAIELHPWRKQAKEQAKKGQRWLLMCRIPEHPGCFYVECAEVWPDVWHSNDSRKRWHR